MFIKSSTMFFGALALTSTLGSAASIVFQFDYQMTGGAGQGSEAGWTAVNAPKNAGDDNTGAPGTRSDSAGGVTATLTGEGNASWVTARGGTGESRSTTITGTSWNDMVEDLVAIRGGTSGNITIGLTGLTPAATYTLTGWHNDSYTVAGNLGFAGTPLYSVTPSVTTGTLVGVADAGNSSNVRNGARSDSDFDTSMISFIPSGTSAEIYLTSGSSQFLAISGLQLEVIPEPSGTALLGLSGLALILRRRRS